MGIFEENMFDRIAEEIIKKAMKEGAFDNLAGKGKPLDLQDDPLTPQEWKTAYKLLRDNGFALPWVEERNEIVDGIEKCCSQTREAYRSADTRFEREKIVSRFQEKIEAINRRIFQYNLQAPSIHFQLRLLDAKTEVSKLDEDERNPREGS